MASVQRGWFLGALKILERGVSDDDDIDDDDDDDDDDDVDVDDDEVFLG